MAEIALVGLVVSLLMLASPSTQLFGALGLLALTVIFPWVFVGLFAAGAVAYIAIKFFGRK